MSQKRMVASHCSFSEIGVAESLRFCTTSKASSSVRQDSEEPSDVTGNRASFIVVTITVTALYGERSWNEGLCRTAKHLSLHCQSRPVFRLLPMIFPSSSLPSANCIPSPLIFNVCVNGKEPKLPFAVAQPGKQHFALQALPS